MSNDAVMFFARIPGIIWSLFTSFNIPGLGFTPASFIFGVLSVAVVLYVVHNIFTVGGMVADDLRRHKPVVSESVTRHIDQYGNESKSYNQTVRRR